jgi:hypothetical protein
MEKFATTILLLTALALPVVLFLLFRPRSRLGVLVAAAVAVAAGWSFNIACVYATEAMAAVRDPSQVNSASVAIAVGFGWVCPLILVLITWLAWHFVTRRIRPDNPFKPTAPRPA